ncbi:MAG: Pur operon repressor [Euryarchaeota archaeon UBA443]|jgi:adenine phosphoribosyltransferase|nr:hypoxanthine/guanine phosphoribosyltransferase [Candidatus Poseidoniaceae archaeon]CAI8388604.1 MAG: Pur operon repressor [Euryarchaeota archaeon UBA443]|tara:strand:+ start:16613 stop:17194 length:582 start_codon:yes stop_codon:yes gene_type:complete
MSNSLQRLKESLLAAPIIWKGDYPYFIHPLTDGVPRLDPSVLTAVVELIEAAVDWESVDLVLGIEAMGLPLTSPLSMRNNKPQVVVRKRSYGLEGEVTIDQSTGYSKGTMYLNDINEGERVLIVDDVLSTGGTLDAIIKGVETLGAQIESVVVVVEKGPGLGQLQEKYPHIEISSIIRLEMDGEKVVLLDEVI